MVGADAIQRVDLASLVGAHDEWSRIVKEGADRAEARSGAVVVVARPLGYALASGRFRVFFLRGRSRDRDAILVQRQRVHGSQHREPSPSHYPERGALRELLGHTQRGLERLRSRAVRVIGLEIVTLHDTELQVPAPKRLA